MSLLLLLKLYFYTDKAVFILQGGLVSVPTTNLLRVRHETNAIYQNPVVGSDINGYCTEICGQPLETTISFHTSKGW